MNEQLIALEFLQPNPYQPRQNEDPAAVQELAENIERNATEGFDGLLQAPTVRAIGEGHYQLAFGHTRKAAFAYLFNQGKSTYGRIRVYVRELTDVQMFEAAVAENIKRRDLNPIEQAESMRRYMVEFGKTSKEAGEFFNCSEENVRAKVRLLNLPEIAREKVRAGEINENAARPLLTIARLFPGNDFPIKDAILEMSNGEKPEDALESVLRTEGRSKIIGNEANSHFSIKAKTFKYLPELGWTYNGIAELLGTKIETYNDKNFVENTIERLIDGEKLDQFSELIDQTGLKKLATMIKPPACTACQYFAQIDGTGYCALAACFDRKKIAQEEQELHTVSEKTGIAILSKEDGAYTQLRTFEDKHKAAFNKRNADLRLKRGGNGYNNFDGVPSDIYVVAVGKLHETWKKQEEKSRADRGQPTEKVDYERLRAIREIRDAQLSLFAWDIAAPAFAALLEGVKVVEVLMRIDDEMSSGILDMSDDLMITAEKLKKMSKPAALTQLRKSIAYAMLGSRTSWELENKISSSKTPVATFAKHVQGLATTWGVKLPKDFMEKAAEHDDAVKLAIAELDKQDKDGDE